jgi:hypothetical protein
LRFMGLVIAGLVVREVIREEWGDGFRGEVWRDRRHG